MSKSQKPIKSQKAISLEGLLANYGYKSNELHFAAQIGRIKNFNPEILEKLTPEMLQEKNVRGETILNIAQENGCIKDFYHLDQNNLEAPSIELGGEIPPDTES